MFKPRYIYWEICDCCNLDCKHCFAGSGTKKRFFAEKDILMAKVLEMCKVSSVPIRFGGGEPLLHPQLFDILKSCTNENIPISMTTNGTLLTSEVAKQLDIFHLQALTISIDGTKLYHDELRGSGAFDRACAGLMNAMEHGLPVSLAFTATATNYKNFLEYISYFYNLGIRSFHVFRYIPNYEAEDSAKLELKSGMLFELTQSIMGAERCYQDIKIIYEKFGQFAFLLDEKNLNSRCKFLSGFMTIRVDGTVVVCAAIQKSLGNIYKDSLESIYRNILEEMHNIQMIPEECGECAFSASCMGGCKCYSYNMTGGYAMRDNGCYKNLLHI